MFIGVKAKLNDSSDTMDVALNIDHILLYQETEHDKETEVVLIGDHTMRINEDVVHFTERLQRIMIR